MKDSVVIPIEKIESTRTNRENTSAKTNSINSLRA